MIMQLIAAMAGTIAFSVLFSVPRKYYVYCGLIGGAGWGIYSLLQGASSPAIASMFATMVVIFLSRFTAVWQRCPVTIFLISGIFQTKEEIEGMNVEGIDYIQGFYYSRPLPVPEFLEFLKGGL